MRPSLPKNNFSKENISFLKKVEGRLVHHRVPSAHFEAENLVRHFGGINRLDFFAGEKTLSSRARQDIKKALKARLGGQPLYYLLKETDFFGRKFFVTKDTLIPRPETELVVEETVKCLDTHYPKGHCRADILEIGTGSGCIAACLTLARPDCRMTAVEISQAALKIARKNIDLHGLSKKIKLIESDLFSAFEARTAEGSSRRRREYAWDVIVSNPPYVPEEDFPFLSKEVRQEPALALNGGPKGLSVIYAILDKTPSFLKRGGWLIIELGKGQSKPLAKKLLKERRFAQFKFIKDYAGIDRILVAQNG